jgi:hypothetical protein
MAERKQVDWEGVERDYSAGILSLRELADKYSVAHVTIKKKADRLNWARNLGAKINAEAERRANTATANSDANSKKAITEKEIINANAQAIVDIKLGHRTDIARGRGLVAKLFDELESCTDNKELFDELGELLRSEDKNGQDKLNDLYHKIISMPQRIDSVKKLSESLRILIDKERQAFDIQDKTLPNKPVEDLTDEEINRQINALLSKSN